MGESEIAHISQADPNMIWIHQNWRKQNSSDLRRLDLSTKEIVPVETHDIWVTQWIIDSRDRLRGRITREKDLSHRLELYDLEQKSWRMLIAWKFDEIVKFLGFDRDEQSMWMLSNRLYEHVSLVRLNLENGEEDVICQDPHSDIMMVNMSKKQKKPIIAYSFPDYPRIHYLDEDIEKKLKPFHPAPPNGFHVIDTNGDESMFGFNIYTSTTIDAYLYDRKADRKHYLFDSVISLYSSKLAITRPIAFSGRDGMTIKGYLTLPKGVTAKNLPTVLLVHGGPWSRDYWKYNQLVQFLANRGYVVLQVNYRGSLGYGKTYMRKAMGEFAAKMHDDLVDGVQWAVDQGYADPNHVAIMGWSYGGYATLVGLTVTPELFACGIDIAGPSDLTTLITKKSKDMSPNGTYYWHKYAGNPEEDSGREVLKAKSPLPHVANIRRPLLVFHGGEDRIVSSVESDQMVEAMKKAGKQVDYVYFPDEGHSFRKWKNWSVLFRKVEVFLGTHLGGRY
jgi:dipeptidyl aminopeptidase/acylaminoacyl peptidase